MTVVYVLRERTSPRCALVGLDMSQVNQSRAVKTAQYRSAVLAVLCFRPAVSMGQDLN